MNTNTHHYTPREQQLVECLGATTALVKLCCGIGNNAAWMVCLEARDMAKKHPDYRKRMKGGHTPEWYFKRVIKMHEEYERRLIYGGPLYFFRMQDLKPEVRKQYGDISDREYYEFWCAIGEKAYSNTRPYITCLANKFRLCFERHGNSHPDISAWLCVAQCCLHIACDIFNSSIRNAAKAFGAIEYRLRREFVAFDMAPLEKAWTEAGKALDPFITSQLDETEERNIALGIEDLTKRWIATQTLYGSMADTFEDYEEVWRTPGYQDKAIRSVYEDMAEVQKAEAEEEILTQYNNHD